MPGDVGPRMAHGPARRTASLPPMRPLEKGPSWSKLARVSLPPMVHLEKRGSWKELVAGKRRERQAVNGVELPVLRLYGFRGLRTVHGTPIKELPPEEQEKLMAIKDEEPLLWAGHVALSTDGGKTLYGFQCVVPPGYSTHDVISQLMAHQPLPGLVTDDTALFEKARQKARDEGWNTHVFQSHKLLNAGRLDAIHRRLVALSQITDGSHGYKYCFPTLEPNPITGQYFPDDLTANCATFAQMAFGVTIPDPSGHLRHFMTEVQSAATSRGFKRLRASSIGDSSQQAGHDAALRFRQVVIQATAVRKAQLQLCALPSSSSPTTPGATAARPRRPRRNAADLTHLPKLVLYAAEPSTVCRCALTRHRDTAVRDHPCRQPSLCTG